MKNLCDLLGKQILFLDGASGSILQSWGLKPGELPETWNYKKPEKIVQLGYNYFSAGSNIIYTNTFGAYKTKFGLDLKKIVQGGVKCAKDAREKWLSECKANGKVAQDCFVALDIGPCGKLLKPMGDLDFEDAVDIFRTTIDFGLEADVDAIVIETMNDAYETKAAVVAAKEARESAKKDDKNAENYVPILVTNVYDLQCHLLTGANPETMVAILEGLGIDALGLNCSLGPKEMFQPAKRLIQAASIPVIVKPNAGLPREVDGKTVFDVGPEEFATEMKKIAELGAAILGGCCGTTPEHISTLKKMLSDADTNVSFGMENKSRDSKNVRDSENVSSENENFIPLYKPIEQKNKTIIASYTHTVQIGGDAVPVLIGERINPTGKKKFKEALRNKDLPYIIHQGLEQEEAGAHVLDVNVGLPEINEKEMMVKVMTELQAVTNLPLQIDTSSPEVMEAALRRYNGKALVNSVNGKQHIMDAVFPLVKKYGGVVVGLTIDEEGIPETTEGRVRIAKKIYENAAKWGIPKKDVIIDSLTMAVSSDTNAAKATLQTIKIVRDELGGSSVLGVSNISFGLPNRPFVTSTFFTLAMHNGLGAAIMNPLDDEMMKAWHCFVLLKGQDKDCLNYLKFSEKYDEKKKTESDKAALSGVQSAVNAIYSAFPSFGQVNPAIIKSNLPNEDCLRALRGENLNHQKDSLNQKTSVVEHVETTKKKSGSGITVVSTGSTTTAFSFTATNSTSTEPPSGTLQHAVIHGLKDDSARFTEQLLNNGTAAVDVIDKNLIPGLDYVGKKFEQKKMYLPQLLMAADAAKSAFEVIKSYLEKTGQKGEPKGTCIVATVHGDIHDIGKNIVKVLLENYDFNVIDLGKDVPPEVVVEACKKDHVELVGLSALMTTTVPAMKATIELLRKECPWAKCCVGGAVMTQEYADSIGADFYGKDAMDTVKYAQKVFGIDKQNFS